MESEIDTLQNFDSQLENLKKQEQTLQNDLSVLATKMHDKRKKGAAVLSDSVNAELEDLNMKGVTFHVSVDLLSDSKGPVLSSTGTSDVEFLSQTSPKDPKRSLLKAASGGELSRILLSLKRVVGASEYPRTYLFDEVDTGVSGTTAEKVGKKLKSIAKGQQVICVTHLPQVAASGDHHFYISKSTKDHGVSMEVTELTAKDRVQEIARLISGEKITKTSIAHAQELLKH
jgi:DNA repair protein RecN (Recombination protein N)